MKDMKGGSQDAESKIAAKEWNPKMGKVEDLITEDHAQKTANKAASDAKGSD